MLPEIQTAYLDGRLLLFLGSGSTQGSLDATSKPLPMSSDLAAELANKFGLPYNAEPLSTVYSAFASRDPSRLHSYIRNRLTNTKPSKALRTIASYPWSRLYTTNIDDCLEKALRSTANQRLSIYSANSPLEEIDPIYQTIQLIKLNGTADKPENGFIFSPQEYAEGSARLPTWYRELAQDYNNYIFLFIGTSLNEPLLQHAIAEMRSRAYRSPQHGYVLTPSATDIEKHHLGSLSLTHIPGTIENFANWMRHAISNIPTSWDLATARRPELRQLGTSLTEKQKRALNSVTAVSSNTLPRALHGSSDGSIRNFYRGFKPDWRDILDEVPANISAIVEFGKQLAEKNQRATCFALIGQAGSGKSTAMMTVALQLSQSTNYPIYFLREPVSDIRNVILTLEELNSDKYFLFVDKIDSMHKEIAECFESSIFAKGCIVFAERINIWTRRIRHILGKFTVGEYTVSRITEEDAEDILSKVQRYGPWTRLQRMPVSERMEEIYARADRQLLIGLLEATLGTGFTQIIRNDYANVEGGEHRKLLVLVGLASIHRCGIRPNIVGRALQNLGVREDVAVLESGIRGIVLQRGGRLVTRHSVYARELFEKVLDPDLIRDCLVALLDAYADYDAPVARSVGKEEGTIFRSIMNHRFVRQMMRQDEQRVRSVYSPFETRFHIDGLYWLQYGLALRGFGRHRDALAKFETAREAFNSHQIEHAYGQQLLIMAESTSSRDEAGRYVDTAVKILEGLNDGGREGDAYPIVTLAEGHIRVVMKFDGVERARQRAAEYANKLSAAHRRSNNERVQQALTKVMTFATTGELAERYQVEEGDYLDIV